MRYLRSCQKLGRARAGRRGFSMIEIAIALAVIGFALVAIIGILPTGLNVQRDTREKTIINQDAMYFMDAIKSSARGLDDLTNFVTRVVVDGSTNAYPAGFKNGYELIGLLTRSNEWSSPFLNVATAYVHAITASAMDRSQFSRDLSFAYRMEVAMTPVRSMGTNYLNYPLSDPNAHILSNLQSRLWGIRLEFAWPLRANGTVGNNRAVYSSMASGVMDIGTNPPPNTPISPRYQFIYP